MTTEDPYKSGDIIITDGTKPPRGLEELLKLDTYQGMTDAEIKLVIAYKERLALKYKQIEHDKEVAQARFEAFSQKCEKQMKQAQDNFNKAINLTIELKAVDE